MCVCGVRENEGALFMLDISPKEEGPFWDAWGALVGYVSWGFYFIWRLCLHVRPVGGAARAQFASISRPLDGSNIHFFCDNSLGSDHIATFCTHVAR